jgi:hypothetical protein
MTTHPYSKCKVYYSGSIKGIPEPDKELPWKLVRFMAEGGADVLSEHVAARSHKEMEEIRAKRIGDRMSEVENNPEPWFGVRKMDLEWVEEATHLVALVNSPSSGVGMEIQHAIDKPRMGLNKTPILCLVREDLADKITWMIRGLTSEEAHLRTYKDYTEATQLIDKFLRNEL